MLHSISNGVISVVVSEDGAELKSLTDATALEWMWQADPNYWSRTSPVLFPFVGRLHKNQYTFQGQQYSMSQHGFARDKKFSVEKISPTCLECTLSANDETFPVYPFDFTLVLRYSIEGSKLQVEYEVRNNGASRMYFSLGAHPGFRVPLFEGESFKDYYIEFEAKEGDLERQLVDGPFLSKRREKVALEENKLWLDDSLFGVKDAVILEHTKSSALFLKSKNHDRSLTFNYADFRWMAIWSKPGPFLCLEPWQGIADEVEFSGSLEDKLGIRTLERGQRYSTSWSVVIN